MTAAIRPIESVSPTMSDLLASKSTLERELRQRATSIATLRRELTRAIEAPTLVSVDVIDGMLTCTLSSGAVLQRRPICTETPDSVSYGFTWMALDPIPGTRAEIVDTAFAADDNVPQHYATAQRRIAEARTLGMAVVAGDPS